MEATGHTLGNGARMQRLSAIHSYLVVGGLLCIRTVTAWQLNLFAYDILGWVGSLAIVSQSHTVNPGHEDNE